MSENKKELTVSSMYMDGFNHDRWYKGTYLHSELEKEMEYDIFSFDQETDFKEGKHLLIINKKAATFFLWDDDTDIRPGRWSGLLVYDDDEQYDYCENKFNERAIAL